MSEQVHSARQGRVVTVTFERPPLNIFDLDLSRELATALDGLGSPETQLVVLRGAGERAFSAGVSIENHAPETVHEMLDRFHRLIRTVVELEPLTLAVVDGHCLGGGLELAASCDLLLATNRSSFGQPEVKLGCFPPVAAAAFPARLGYGRTLELLVSGRTLDAAEAEGLGLVTWSVDASALDEEIERRIAEITARSAAVTRIIKLAVRSGATAGFEEALAEAERLYRDELFGTEDMREGVDAFLESRRPEWRHR